MKGRQCSMNGSGSFFSSVFLYKHPGSSFRKIHTVQHILNHIWPLALFGLDSSCISCTPNYLQRTMCDAEAEDHAALWLARVAVHQCEGGARVCLTLFLCYKGAGFLHHFTNSGAKDHVFQVPLAERSFRVNYFLSIYDAFNKNILKKDY